jgi:hypothetical protein
MPAVYVLGTEDPNIGFRIEELAMVAGVLTQ